MAAGNELTCERDGTPTLLTCATCSKGICVRCLVHTPAGQKCRACAQAPTPRLRRSRVVIVGLGVSVIVVVALVAKAVGSGGRGSLPAGPVVPTVAVAGLGQPVREGPLSFVATAWECGGKDLGSPPVAVALGRYCLLHFSVTQAGTRPTVYFPSSTFVIDAESRRYGLDQRATRAYPGDLNRALFSAPALQLNPGIVVSGVLVFDIPPTNTPTEAEFHQGPGTLGRLVRLSS